MSDLDRYELFRVVTDIEAIREAVIERFEDLQMSRLTIDEVGGFTPGYSAKLLCTPPMKMIGQDSLPKLLAAGGLVLILAIDDERMQQIRPKLKPKRKIRAVARIKRVKGFFNKENAAKYAAVRWAATDDKKRSRLARRAARARWRARKRHEGDLPASNGASILAAKSASCAHGQPAPIT